MFKRSTESPGKRVHRTESRSTKSLSGLGDSASDAVAARLLLKYLREHHGLEIALEGLVSEGGLTVSHFFPLYGRSSW